MTIMTKHKSTATMSHQGKAAATGLYGRRRRGRVNGWRKQLGFGPVRRRKPMIFSKRWRAARGRKRGGELVLMIWLRSKQRQARGALLPYVVRSHAGTTRAGKGSVTLAKARKWARTNGNRCYVCNRPLTSEESVRNGAGPRCQRKAGFR